jgi:carbonic anhydrase
VIGDKRYELRQFHFHHPSEEQVSGKSFDMAAHLVHSDAAGHLAVIAVLFTEGGSNPTLAKLWRYLTDQVGKRESDTGETINAAALLPQATAYYRFDGSLTTPPCTEPVDWIVLKTPVAASAEQVAALAKLYPHNTRPIQSLNGRTVLESQ